MVAAATPAATARAAQPESIPLVEGWQFAPDPQDRGLAEGGPRARASGSRSRCRTSSTLARSGSLFPGSVGWYRLSLDPGATPDGQAWHLHFEQVRRVARIWLNGVEIGGHADPYVPFEVPATGLRPGSPIASSCASTAARTSGSARAGGTGPG